MQGFKAYCDKCKEDKGLHNNCSQKPQPEKLTCEKHSRILIGKKYCSDCRAESKPQQEEEWEDSFNQIFGTTLWQQHKPPIPYKNEQYQYVSCGETVKDFIREVVAKEKMELVGKIEGIIKKEINNYKGLYDEAPMVNEALNNILSALKSEEKEEVG